MTSTRKSTTVLVTIAALAGMLAVSSVAAHNAFADDAKTVTITISINNKGVNVQTNTDQKQDCQTAGETSPITNSCQTTQLLKAVAF